ncbi:Protein CBG24783 [Caenorhabditis briggsae]|uniref:Protein CBG24783 n=1 Tax=Caenorhabditis briggsae TaxID=6238 RepID=A8WLH2_CAEBR|nr:Protein CBG24783 [Caenorhabditis briggsae]CAP21317.2 Protein CBG24783 [Caenorhabditis briggsae]
MGLDVQRSIKLKPIAEQDADEVITVETTIEVKKFAKALRDKFLPNSVQKISQKILLEQTPKKESQCSRSF